MFDKEEKLSTLSRNYDTLVIKNSFLYIMKNTGLRVEPWGTPCFIVPQSEKKLQASPDGFVSTFFLSSVR
jgi:hypothetical protein